MKQLVGTVTSTKAQKTAIVKVTNLWQHPLYKKRVKRSKKYATDNQIGAKEGDGVRIVEVRPLSKTKRWRIIKVIK